MLGINEELRPHPFMYEVGPMVCQNTSGGFWQAMPSPIIAVMGVTDIFFGIIKSQIRNGFVSEEVFISIKGQYFKILQKSLNIFNPSLVTFLLQNKPHNLPHPFITTQYLSRNEIVFFGSITMLSPTLLVPGSEGSSLQPVGSTPRRGRHVTPQIRQPS